MGLNALADRQMLGPEYQHTGLAVTQSLIKSKPELARNITKAFVEARRNDPTLKGIQIMFREMEQRTPRRLRLNRSSL